MLGKLVGGILLVAGTTIGAAMLALPTITGLVGFFPTIALFLLYWGVLLASALLLLEVNLWFPEEINLVTMAKKTLGPFGEVVSWTTYLFLLYALNTAYLSGSSRMLQSFCLQFFDFCLPVWAAPIPWVLLFGFFVYRGAGAVDGVNRWMMVGLALSYFALIALLFPHVEREKFSYAEPSYLLLAMPVIATSFGFHIIIPTLVSYLDRNVKALRTSIFFGSLLPLIAYVVWEFVMLGILPIEGEGGVLLGYKNDLNGIQLLPQALQSTTVAYLSSALSLFAILTSFLGVSLSLRDFLADGFHVKKSRCGRIFLDILTFFPTLVIMWTNPHVFLGALELAGAYGVMILLALIPALMVWRGRYILGFKGEYRVKGGKVLLAFIVAVAMATVLAEMTVNFLE
jgi:tyrosine-specific transport protein